MAEMIASIARIAVLVTTVLMVSVPASGSVPSPAVCLSSGDGYLRARVAGAIDATIDWPNSGTRCEGEAKSEPAGVRMSFQRDPGSSPNLLFVFGLTGVRPGEAAREVAANLTVIVQGTNRIYGTLGDARCTVDSLTQRPLPAPHSFRIEVRGFCTQPAHAVRGSGAVLVSTFEFAGVVNFEDARDPGGAAAIPTPSVAVISANRASPAPHVRLSGAADALQPGPGGDPTD
jgi:hypothetical protein